MYQTIRYPKTERLAKGRHGFAYSAGVHLSSYKKELTFETVGSRGDTGAARIVIPLSHIPELQAALAAFVAECVATERKAEIAAFEAERAAAEAKTAA